MKTAQVEDFLKGFHERFPGCTSLCMQNGRTENGLSSYDTLARVVEKPGTVLDLACGDGFLLSRVGVFQPGARLIGLDMSEAELKLAAKHPSLELILGNSREIPLPNGSVDYVLCHMAFMLMMNVDEVVTEIHRVLKPGGVFAAIIPDPVPSHEAGSAPKIYLEARDRALAEAKLTPTTWIGDSKTRSEESIRSLLSDFRSVGFQSFDLRHEMSLEEAVQYFSLLYSPGQLSEEAFARFKADLAHSFSRIPLPIALSMPLLYWHASKEG